MLAPVGVLTVIVPVGVLQVGCTTVTVGVAGVAGCALIVTGVEADTQPLVVFLAVTL